MTVIPDIDDKNFIYAMRLTYDPTLSYVYVGQTSKGVLRCRQHIDAARNRGSGTYDTHKSRWLRKHFFAVTFDILEVLESDDTLNLSEMRWIAIFKERDYTLLNKTDGGEGVRGHVMGSESRLKMRNAKLGRPRSEDTKRKISEFNRGKTLSAEHRQLLSSSKMGEDNPMFGKLAWNSGKKMSELTPNYVNSNLGVKYSEERKKKLSEIHTGLPNRGRHTRWHENRGVVKDGCEFCPTLGTTSMP